MRLDCHLSAVRARRWPRGRNQYKTLH